MKKIIFIIVVVLLIGSLWWNLRNSAGIQITMLKGETAKLSRGSLTIPITANGTIEPRERSEIKSEAGGRVIRLPFEVGQMVRQGDLLVELDPEDEQRMVDTADKALKQAGFSLERARNTRYQREFVDLPSVQATLDGTTAEYEYLEWRKSKIQGDFQNGIAHPDEYRAIKSQFDQLTARKAQQQAAVERARKNIELADVEVQTRELAVARAEDDLEQARERLKETKIMAARDGMLSRLFVQEGNVITSGSASFGGGTLLGTLADISELYVRAEIDESDIGRVRDIAPPDSRPGHTTLTLASGAAEEVPVDAGQLVTVTVEAFPDDEFKGVIELIEPEAVKIGQVATYIVRIQLISDDVAGKLFLGMQANVEFVSESIRDAVLVPNEAVHYVAGERGAYIPVDSQKKPGKKVPEFKSFKAGLDNGMYTQVVEGLQQGEVVYTKLPRTQDGKAITGDD